MASASRDTNAKDGSMVGGAGGRPMINEGDRRKTCSPIGRRD